MPTVPPSARDKAVELLKKFEGFSPVPYWDVNGWAIGYGTHVDQPPERISEEEASQLLGERVAAISDALGKLVTPDLKDHQWAALISWAYNVGVRAASKSRLIAAINRGDMTEAARQFDRWVYSKGKLLPGLVKRRELERKVFEGEVKV